MSKSGPVVRGKFFNPAESHSIKSFYQQSAKHYHLANNQEASFTCEQLHLDLKYDFFINYDKINEFYEKEIKPEKYKNSKTKDQKSDPETDKTQLFSKHKLTVHIVPFTNLPVVREMTTEVTYSQKARKIVRSIITYLQNNTDHRISVLGSYFFNEYIKSPHGTQDDKYAIRNLTNSERLEIVGNGLVSPDYSVTRFESLIHQMAMGAEAEGFFTHKSRKDIKLRDKIAFSFNQLGASPTIAHLFRKLRDNVAK